MCHMIDQVTLKQYECLTCASYKCVMKQWTTLNRLRTGVGRYKASMKKWGLADSAACECGEPEQTADHIINSCPIHRPPSEAGIFEVGPLTRAWLQPTELTI